MSMNFKKWLLLALMLVSATLGAKLQPTIYLADELPAIDLKTMIPTAFGDWKEMPETLIQIIDPQQKETLEKIYSETLSRTYINSNGYRIMLSIAYGKSQNKELDLHSPEVCYPAQGFMVSNSVKTAIDVLGAPVQLTRLETHLGQRFEPVSFWMSIGSTVTNNTLDRRLAEFRYAVTGRIPDGILVRVSSIDSDAPAAYAMQTRFANDLLAGISPAQRGRFMGSMKQP
jgi:EpsI family protein